MMNLTPYAVLLVGMTIFCSISGLVIVGAVRAHALFGSRFFNSTRNSNSMKQDLSNLEQTIKLNVAEEDDKNPDVIPSTKGEFSFRGRSFFPNCSINFKGADCINVNQM